MDEWTRIVGWIAPNSSFAFSGPLFVHNAAAARPSAVHGPAKRSMCTTHPSFSVLDPASMTPGWSSTGFARIGPRMPEGRVIAADHVRPTSDEMRARPHHCDGLGPTL